MTASSHIVALLICSALDLYAFRTGTNSESSLLTHLDHSRLLGHDSEAGNMYRFPTTDTWSYLCTTYSIKHCVLFSLVESEAFC
jgi:hypothetical protein